MQCVCMYMYIYVKHDEKRIESFIKIYYNRLRRIIYAVLSNDRENLNILERVINGTKVFSLFIFHVYSLDMRVIYNCGSKLSDTCYASKSCLLLIVSLFRTSGTRRKRKKGRKLAMNHHSSIIPNLIYYSYLLFIILTYLTDYLTRFILFTYYDRMEKFPHNNLGIVMKIE